MPAVVTTGHFSAPKGCLRSTVGYGGNAPRPALANEEPPTPAL
jgi:hypothetical protein